MPVDLAISVGIPPMDPKSPYFNGHHWPSDTPANFFKATPLPPTLKSPYFDPLVRIPLYQAALGDEIIVSHHWSYDSLKFSDVAGQREQMELFYMVPPMYHLNRETWPERRERIVRHFKFWSPIHRKLGAIADYTRMLEFEPKRYSPRFNRAGYFTKQGQMDAAIADYTAIIEDPDTDFSKNLEPKEKLLAETYEYRGLVYQKRKEDDKAVADFTESLRVDPSGGDGMILYWRRGLLYRASQQIAKALEDANSLSQWALQWAIAADSKDSDRDRALTAARFGSEIFEHQMPFQLEVLAATKAKVGDFREAVSEQQRAIRTRWVTERITSLEAIRNPEKK
jgi:tetratricopeptide (TPR) repeat protein